VSDFDYGHLRTYEVVWRSGHIETVQGHQVTFSSTVAMFSHGTPRPPRFSIHGDFPREDGGTDWRLVLHGLEDDVITIRDVTDAEKISGEEASDR
jgi:hypothetical protein